MSYLLTPTGATLNHVVYVYGYSCAIKRSKTVKSLALPNNRNVGNWHFAVSAINTTNVESQFSAIVGKTIL
jgi:hypothetical protein